MDVSVREIPTEIKIKILNFWNIDDIKKYYFLCKDVKDILDYLINKNNYDFIGRLDMILEDIVFQYYSDAFIYCRTKYNLYNGFIEKMYKNKEISIIVWKKKCEKYRFNLPHKLEIMGFVFQEFNNFYNQGKLKETNEINQSLFIGKLISYLNH
jgi:hypothetical protein